MGKSFWDHDLNLFIVCIRGKRVHISLIFATEFMDDLSPLEPHQCPPHATSCPWWDLGLCLGNYKWSSVFTTHNISTATPWRNHLCWLLNQSVIHHSSFNFHFISLVLVVYVNSWFLQNSFLSDGRWASDGRDLETLWVTTRAQQTTDRWPDTPW